MRRLSHRIGQQQHLLQRLQALDVQEMQWAQALDKRPWLQMYMVPENCTPPADGRPQREVQVGPDKLEVVASFCSLGDMLSAASGCGLSTTTRVKTACKKFKELLPVLSPLLFQDTWPCIQLVCGAQCYDASETWPLTKPNLQSMQWIKWQGNDQTDLQCQAARHCHHQVHWATCMAWHWGSGPHSEGEKAPLVWMWNAPVVQLRQPVTYRLMESVGLGGPRWHGSSWQRGIAESGSFRLSTFMLDTPWELVWDLPCMHGRGPTDVAVAPVPAC